MPCPVVHTRFKGSEKGAEKEKGEFKVPGDNKSEGNYIKWSVDHMRTPSLYYADVLRRDADGVEVEQENEKENIEAVSEQFKRFQMYNFNEHMHCLRGTHLKSQGVCYLFTLPTDLR